MADKSDLVKLLGECTPGNLPKDVFDAVARVTVYPAIELIPYRYRGGVLEIGLLQRPAEDQFWPSMWHIPGTVLRPTDAEFQDAFNRLYSEEFSQLTDREPEFIGVNIVPYVRGTGLTIEHAINFTDSEAGVLTFFNATELPETFIAEQVPIIDRLRAYLDRKQLI